MTQAFVYFIKSNIPFLRDFLNLQFLKSGNYTFTNYMIEEYVPGLWINAVNGLNLMIVDHLSRLRFDEAFSARTLNSFRTTNSFYGSLASTPFSICWYYL